MDRRRASLAALVVLVLIAAGLTTWVLRSGDPSRGVDGATTEAGATNETEDPGPSPEPTLGTDGRHDGDQGPRRGATPPAQRNGAGNAARTPERTAVAVPGTGPPGAPTGPVAPTPTVGAGGAAAPGMAGGATAAGGAGRRSSGGAAGVRADPSLSTPATPREPVAAVVAVTRGMVVDETGRGVRDAAVRVATHAGVVPEFERKLSTDADGLFRTDVPDGARVLDAWATVEGYAPVRAECHPGDFTVVRLAKAREIRGRIVDPESGHGLPDAIVYVVDRSIPAWVRRGEPVTTNAFGEFVLLAPQGRVLVDAAAIGYATREVEVASDANDALRIALEARGRLVTLVGTVRIDGEPAAGVAISVNGHDWDAALVGPSTRSTAAGSYRLERVPWPPATVPFTLVVDGGAGRRGLVELRPGVGVERSGEVTLDLSVPLSASLEGVVTVGGRPVPGALVAYVVGRDALGTATTDARGAYRLTLDDAERSGVLRVRTPDGPEFDVEPPPGWRYWTMPVHLDAVVPPFGRVKVRVETPVDGNLHPLAGARVEIFTAVAFTGADGAVDVPLVLRPRDRGPYTVDTFAAGYLRSATTPCIWMESQDVQECRVSMRPGGRVAGRVVDSAHRPIAGAQVEIVPTKPGGGWPAPMTGADGTFDATAWGEQFHVDVSHKEFEPVHVPGVKPDSVVPDIVMTRKGAAPDPTPR